MTSSVVHEYSGDVDPATIRACIENWQFPKAMIDVKRAFSRRKSVLVSFERYIADELDIHERSAEILVREYRRFLILKALYRRVLTPSAIIDDVWHLHLGFQESYADFCELAAGCDIPHVTNLPPEEAREEYAETLRLYESLFRELLTNKAWSSPRNRNFDKVCTTLGCSWFVFMQSLSLYFSESTHRILMFSAFIGLAVFLNVIPEKYYPSGIKRGEASCG